MVGVEFEFYCMSSDFMANFILPASWKIIAEKIEHQYELISPPTEIDEALSSLEPILEDFKVANVVHLDSNCGLHVHIDCSRKSISQLADILKYYWIAEGFNFERFSTLRENDFCLKLSSLITLQQLTHGKLFSSSYRDLIFNFPTLNKGAAINLLALEKFGTLEFRAMGANFDFEQIRNWIFFLEEICND